MDISSRVQALDIVPLNIGIRSESGFEFSVYNVSLMYSSSPVSKSTWTAVHYPLTRSQSLTRPLFLSPSSRSLGNRSRVLSRYPEFLPLSHLAHSSLYSRILCVNNAQVAGCTLRCASGEANTPGQHVPNSISKLEYARVAVCPLGHDVKYNKTRKILHHKSTRRTASSEKQTDDDDNRTSNQRLSRPHPRHPR